MKMESKTKEFQELQEKYGLYESWDQDTLMKITESKEDMEKFTSKSTDEMLGHINDKLSPFVFVLHVSHRLLDSNKKFESLMQQVGVHGENLDDLESGIRVYLNSKGDLFDRLNAYLCLLAFSDVNDEESVKKIKEIDKNQIIEDLNKLQTIVVKCDVGLATICLNSLIDLIYRIDEYYFEITGERVLEEKEDFKDKLDQYSKFVEKYLNEEDPE